jgi:hypothetical protein
MLSPAVLAMSMKLDLCLGDPVDDLQRLQRPRFVELHQTGVSSNV